MQFSSEKEPRMEPIGVLYGYSTSLLCPVLIIAFAFVFHLIYLLTELISDKSKQNKHAMALLEKRELRRKSLLLLKRQHPSDKQQQQQHEENEEKTTKRILNEINYILWTTKNLQISFIHSLLCSLWLTRISLANSEMFDDLFSFVSWDTYLFLTFSCGYFLYDFYDIYSNGHFKSLWVVCLHHWIVLLSFSYHLIYVFNIGYTVISLYMEFNSVFLHARKLLRFYGYDANSSIVFINKLFNISTFTLFRFGVLSMIAWGVLRDGHRVSKSYLFTLLSFTAVMTAINIVLFYNILKNDWLIMNKKRKSGVSHQHNNDEKSLLDQDDAQKSN